MLSKYSRSRLARPHTSFIPINSSREAFRIDRIVLYPSSVGLGASRLGREGEGLAPLCRRVRQPLNDAGNKRNPRASVGTTRQGRRFYSNWPAALLFDRQIEAISRLARPLTSFMPMKSSPNLP